MIVDPITDRERLGWQRRAVRVLAGPLERAQRDGLPVAAWAVLDAGAGVAARCYSRTAFAKDFDGLVDVAVLADLLAPEESP